jgi:hypothetical protein
MPPKNRKSKRVPPKQQRDRKDADFDRMARSATSEQAYVTTLVPFRTREQMKVLGPLMKEWGYIEQVTPFAIAKFCLMTQLDALEKYVRDTVEKKNAGPQNT